MYDKTYIDKPSMTTCQCNGHSQLVQHRVELASMQVSQWVMKLKKTEYLRSLRSASLCRNDGLKINQL